MDICDLDDDVLFHVLDHLPAKDVLQFREAGWRSRDVVNRYTTRLNKRLCLNYHRIFGKWDLQDILGARDYFAYPAVYLENVEADIHCMMRDYGAQYGVTVDKLKVDSFSVHQTQMEKAFYGSLQNLTELWIEDLKHCNSFYDILVGKSIGRCALPEAVFGHLKSMKFDKASDAFVVHFLLQNSPQLRNICYGIVGATEEPGMKTVRDTNIVKNLSQFLVSRQPGPLIIDFADFDYNEAPNALLCELISHVATQDVTLYGFPAHLLNYVAEGYFRTLNEFQVNSFISHVYGVKDLTAKLCLRRLERLCQISAVHITEDNLQSFEQDYPATMIENWPILEKIDIWIDIDSSFLNPATQSGQIIQKFLQFFFNGTSNVKDLKIRLERSRALSYMMPNVWVPNFKNLRHLDLDIYFYFTEVLGLFTALGRNTRIRKLKLILRGDVNAYVFIGPDREHPAFLEMTDLKHFEINVKKSNFLRDLPITVEGREWIDRMFTLVFARSNLTCLKLKSVSNWHFPVSVFGINAMLSGVIGNTLRYLEFSHSYFPADGKVDFDAALSRINKQIEINRNMQLSVIRDYGECSNCFYL